MNQETMRRQLAKKAKYMRKTAKHSARLPKLKDARVVQHNRDLKIRRRRRQRELPKNNRFD